MYGEGDEDCRDEEKTKVDVGMRTRRMTGNLREKKRKWVLGLAGPSFQFVAQHVASFTARNIEIFLVLVHIKQRQTDRIFGNRQEHEKNQ